MKNQLWWLMLILVISMTACQKDGLASPEDYRSHVENPDNGLIQFQEHEGIRYTLRYLPTTYQALKEYDFDELDSLKFSPRTGKMWTYTANDTARVKTYLLEDPDSDDRIGTLLADITLLNAASWE